MMNRSYKYKILTRHYTALLILIAWLLSAASPAPAAAPYGAVHFSRGEVTILQAGGGQVSSLPPGSLGTDDRILTGKDALAEIILESKSVLRLGPDTRLAVKDGQAAVLEQGTLCLQAPAGVKERILAGKMAVDTAGATIMVAHAPGQAVKIIALEGKSRAAVSDRFGEWLILAPGKMLMLPPESRSLPDPVDVDLDRLAKSSFLIRTGTGRDKAPAVSLDRERIQAAVTGQQLSLAKGDLDTTNLFLLQGSRLFAASANQLTNLENRMHAWSAAPSLTAYTLKGDSVVTADGRLTQNGLTIATGNFWSSGNGGFSNFLWGAPENAFESNYVRFNNHYNSISSVTNFTFKSLTLGGSFTAESPTALSLASREGMTVASPVTVKSPLTSLNLTSINGLLNINQSITASVPTISVIDRAKITQGSGEYYGVDKWQTQLTLNVGDLVVNGSNNTSISTDYTTAVADSNYFAPLSTKTAATPASGGNPDARMYNGLVQVGPFRVSGTTGTFNYRTNIMTYEIVRPLPVAYALVSNNPQFNTAGGNGGGYQYFAPFSRYDLIRLGYIRQVETTAADNITAIIPRYVNLVGQTSTQEQLNELARQDYLAAMATRADADEAERLRLEAIAIRTNKSRSSQEFFAYAKGSGSDLTLNSGAYIDGFAKTTLAAENNVNIYGTVWGTDNTRITAGAGITVANGALLETFTDNQPTGGGTIILDAQGPVTVGGRVQTVYAPWTATASSKPGQIDITSGIAATDTVAIDIQDSGQLLAILASTPADKTLNRVTLTSAGGKIKVSGLGYGYNILADKGLIDIRNNGMAGAIDVMGGAALRADTIKIGALGQQGVLNIYGGAAMNADTMLKLYGGEISGGKVIFATGPTGSGNVSLTSPAINVGANLVQVNTGVTVTTSTNPNVYCQTCNWAGEAGATQTGTWSKVPNKLGIGARPAY